MKGKEWALAIILGLVIPSLIFSAAECIMQRGARKEGNTESTSSVQTEETSETQIKTGNTIFVLLNDNVVQKFDLDTYVLGVLLGEMPADFEAEALKAQAVVARTYALKRNTSGKKHKDGAICVNPGCCQAYCSVETYLQQGGTSEDVSRMEDAVKSTEGQVLTYSGKLIEATYFS